MVFQWAMGYMCHFQHWFPQGICIGVGLLSHVVILFLVFKGISILFSIEAVSIYIPTNNARAFPFLHIFFRIIVCRLFDEGSSDQCEVISHCSFDVHFSNNELFWASLHVFVSYLYVFFGEMSVKVFHPLFDWVICFSDIELYERLIYFRD